MSGASPLAAKRLSQSVFCRNASETSTLANRLWAFYTDTRDYRAFQAPSNQTLLHIRSHSSCRKPREV